MSKKISPKLIDKLWELKVKLDLYRKASASIERGHRALDKHALKEFKARHHEVREGYSECLNKVVKTMPLGNNTLEVSPDWYLIRYQLTSGDLTGRIYPINKYEIEQIRIDGRHESELTETTFNELICKIQDMTKMQEYEESSEECIDMVLNPDTEQEQAYKSEQEEITIDTQSYIVRHHAMERYAERVLNIPTKQVSEYLSNNRDEVLSSILEGRYSDHCNPVWEESDTKYWFNDDSNIMYVTDSEDGSIITLYEKDYGFSKDINNSIVHQQLEVLKLAKETYEKMAVEAREERDEHRNAISDLEDDIESLRLKADALSSQLQVRKESIESSLKEESLYRHEYQREYNKLFKKWER